MEYSLIATQEHPYASGFGHNLNELVRKDEGTGIFPNETIAISLDEVEKSLRKNQPSKTMDTALGIIKRGTAKRPKNKRMLLCEFRFNYKNPGNISKTEIEGKVIYSKTLLMCGFNGDIEPKCYFLFNKKIFEQAKNYFSRIYNTRTQDRIVMSEVDFRNLLF